jgi:hypothetical protein
MRPDPIDSPRMSPERVAMLSTKSSQLFDYLRNRARKQQFLAFTDINYAILHRDHIDIPRCRRRRPLIENTAIALTRRPAPSATESLFGYILRLSEKNGYDSYRRLLARGGLQYWNNSAGFDVAILLDLPTETSTKLRALLIL